MQSSQNDQLGDQNQKITNPDPTVITGENKKKTKMKWSTEDYRNVLRAFYRAQLTTNKNITDQTYDEWRELVGKDYRKYINT